MGIVRSGSQGQSGSSSGLLRIAETDPAIVHIEQRIVDSGPRPSCVKNFDQIKVGDQVDTEYVEALTLELRKSGGQKVARTEQAAAVGAKPGEQPSGAAGRQVTIVADAVGLDPATQTVTLKGPNRTVDLHVNDPEQFNHISEGDQVEATYTQALAVTVEPKAKK